MTTVSRIQVSRQPRRFAIRTYVDVNRIANYTVEARPNNVLQAAIEWMPESTI